MERRSSSQKGDSLEHARKSTPPPFLLKTYMLVEDPATDGAISWNADGSGFVVWQPPEFARDLLPTLFKHSNFSSFVRQLNTYGFRKVATSRWEFCNDMFRKGEKELLCKIRRRKAWANKQQPVDQPGAGREGRHPLEIDGDEDHRSPSTSSSSGHSSLVDENRRLREENGALSSELLSTKKKCKDLLHLVSKYAMINNHSLKRSSTSVVVSAGGDEEEGEDRREERGPKLFGVRLGEGDGTRKRKAAEAIRGMSLLRT